MFEWLCIKKQLFNIFLSFSVNLLKKSELYGAITIYFSIFYLLCYLRVISVLLNVEVLKPVD